MNFVFAKKKLKFPLKRFKDVCIFYTKYYYVSIDVSKRNSAPFGTFWVGKI